MCVSLFTIKEESTVKCSRVKTKMQSQKLLMTVKVVDPDQVESASFDLCPNHDLFYVKIYLFLNKDKMHGQKLIRIPSTILNNVKE